jgi:hypothetical protein
MNKTKRKRNIKNKTKKNLYEEKDFNSNNGFLTTIWGPAIWHFLHIISFNYPVDPSEENKKHYLNFMINLKYILPCKKCRENLVKNYKELPITMKNMKNRYTFSLYVYNLHELINKMLHKTSNLSYEDVRQRYEHFRARNCNDMMNKELGCSKPQYGKKTKCILKIVPQNKKCESFQMNRHS